MLRDQYEKVYRECKNAIKNGDTETALEHFETMLNRHDWYFEYSDDHSVWSRGASEEDAIGYARSELNKLCPTQVEKMYKAVIDRKFGKK